MATQLKKVWKVLSTDIREFLYPAEVVASGADVSKAIVDCSLPLELLCVPSSLRCDRYDEDEWRDRSSHA